MLTSLPLGEGLALSLEQEQARMPATVNNAVLQLSPRKLVATTGIAPEGLLREPCPNHRACDGRRDLPKARGARQDAARMFSQLGDPILSLQHCEVGATYLELEDRTHHTVHPCGWRAVSFYNRLFPIPFVCCQNRCAVGQIENNGISYEL